MAEPKELTPDQIAEIEEKIEVADGLRQPVWSLEDEQVLPNLSPDDFE